MLIYKKIKDSEDNDVNKISASRKCSICQYWYFEDKGFQFEPNNCNEYHDILMTSMNLNDIAILNIRGIDHCCIINRISKSKAVNLL